jgi:hypothetical protein
MKLRIRFYDDEWKRPAFLEVKRRVSEVICKDRAMMTREGVRQILTAGWPNQAFLGRLHSPHPRQATAGRERGFLDVCQHDARLPGAFMSPITAKSTNRRMMKNFG